MATLITLEQAKEELRITHTDEDAVITRKLEESEAMVFRLLNFTGEPPSPFAPDPPWTSATVPADMRGALMLAFVDLWRWRGDDEELPEGTSQGGDGWASPRLMGMLRRWMDPVNA